jgi:predicted ribosomally synthesized peptide with SipW-like signal peptide
MLISMLVIALAAAAIGGATMAWFTDEAEVPDVTFTAGTVIVNVDEDPVITTMEDRSIENVNPGDCATVCWNILNKGTKRAELRVKVDSGWVDPVQEEKQVVFFAPKPDSGWVMYEDEDGLWLYYINGPVAPVAGTNGDDEGVDEGEDESDEPEGVKLCLVVGFDGPSMDNRYQGLSYSIGGTVYAVQASNGAPEDLWGEAWEEVKSEGYTDDSLKAYFLTGNGASMPCWSGGETPEPELMFQLSNVDFEQFGISDKKVRVTATITAINDKGETVDFDGVKNVNIVIGLKRWVDPPGPTQGSWHYDSESLTNMPVQITDGTGSLNIVEDINDQWDLDEDNSSVELVD